MGGAYRDIFAQFKTMQRKQNLQVLLVSKKKISQSQLYSFPPPPHPGIVGYFPTLSIQGVKH